jgi:hypothetical protein
MLLPGDYHVRIVQGKRKSMTMEFLVTDKNGKPKAEGFEIVEVTQFEEAKPEKASNLKPEQKNP